MEGIPLSQATQLHNRGYLADSRQIMTRCPLLGNVQDEVYQQAHARALATVKPGGLLPKRLGAC